MQIMPRSVKLMHTIPAGHCRPAQPSAHTISSLPLTEIGPTQIGEAVPPGAGSQSAAGFAQPVSEQYPSVMSALVMQRMGMFPQSCAVVHDEYMPSAG